MKREIRTLTAVYLFVLLLLMVSSLFDGILNIIVYILSFILPFLLGMMTLRKDGREKNFDRYEYLGIRKEDIAMTLSLIFPAVLSVIAVSFGTSALFESLFGITGKNVDLLANGVLWAVISYAVLPAFLEELLFRYLPMKLTGKRSPRLTVVFSAVFFALIHHSFFSIPYAFVAGVIFMAIDISLGSVLPSFIIHLANNLFALLSAGVFGVSFGAEMTFITVGGLSLASLIYILIKRKKLAEMLRAAFASGEEYIPSLDPLFFAAPSLFIAVCELIFV